MMSTTKGFLTGAARALWVSAWASAQEEDGVSMSGMDLDECAPPTPNEALIEAAKWIGALEAVNGKHLARIEYEGLIADGYSSDESASDYWVGARDARYAMGHGLMLEAMGHGASWFDDHPRFELKMTTRLEELGLEEEEELMGDEDEKE